MRMSDDIIDDTYIYSNNIKFEAVFCSIAQIAELLFRFFGCVGSTSEEPHYQEFNQFPSCTLAKEKKNHT